MRGYFALLKVNFKNLLLTSLSGGASKRKRSISAIGAVALMAALMLFISGSFSFSMMMAFAPLGGQALVFEIMLLVALLLPTMLMLFGAQGTVFSQKDVDLVFSLPVSSFSVMMARVSALYIESLILVEFLMLPAIIAYLISGGAGGVLFVVMALLQSALWALLPAVIALVFGFLVSVVVSRLPFKNLFTVVFSLLFVVLIFIGSFALGPLMENATITSLASVQVSVESVFPPLGWFMEGTGGNILNLLLLVAATLLPFLLAVWVFSRFYKTIMTNLMSHRLKANYKLRGVKATGATRALLKKEAGRFFGTPGYLMNCGIMMFLMIILSVVAVFMKNTIQEYVALLLGIPGGESILAIRAPLLLGVIGFALIMVYTSSVSISLEGKYLWILKEAPLGTGRIFATKAGFNSILCSVCTLICVPLLGYALAMPVLEIALIVLLLLLFGACSSLGGLLCNLQLPRMDYVNEIQVIKNSGSVFLHMLVDLLVAGIVAVLYYVCYRLALGFVAFSLLAAVLLVLVGAVWVTLLNTRGRRQFEELV